MELVAVTGTTRKSVFTPSLESAAIGKAIRMARGVDRVLPVFLGDRVIAKVCGSPWWAEEPGAVYWKPTTKYDCVINSYSDFRDAIDAGNRFSNQWFKAQTGTPADPTNWYDHWLLAGDPSPATYGGTTLVANQCSDTTPGAIWTGGNVSPAYKHFASWVASCQARQPSIMLYDRVIDYHALAFSNPVGTVQNMDNTLTAQRYVSAGEAGMKVLVCGQTALGATATTFSQMEYTDDAGNATQAMPTAFGVNIIVSAGASSNAIGSRVVSPSVAAATQPIGPFMPLLPGDNGARLVKNYATTGAGVNTGTFVIALVYPLAYMPIQIALHAYVVEQLMQVTSFARIFDGACLSTLAFNEAAVGSTYNGRMEFVWG